MNRFRTVFMGTPAFAVPSLEALHGSGHAVSLVVTQPDRPKGRGKRPAASPVKESALRLGLPLAQPESIRSTPFYDRVAALAPDMIVVVAFGQILPGRLLDLPPHGAINVHASLLPRYRGAAPIQWAIINREKKTGVTTMVMDRGLDTGDLLLSVETELTRDETSQTLHDRLSNLGADLLVRTVEGLRTGRIQPVPQPSGEATFAPTLKKKDGCIDWHKSAERLDAFIRGMNPWPGAFTFWGDKLLKIFSAIPVPASEAAPPGRVVGSFPDELRVATGHGALSILELQAASGKRLPVREFLRGNPLPPGVDLG